MPLDPTIQGLLSLLESAQAPAIHEGTPAEGRRAFRTLAVDLRDPAAVVPVGSTEDITIEGATGPLQARVYRPAGADGSRPTIAFFHGGGFVIGDIETHDNQCRWVCREVDAVIVSVAYRLAPEAPFPAPVEDCLAATRWAAANIDELGGDPDRLAVAGDSAGGNLAAVVTQISRDQGAPSIAAQLLIYPSTDFVDDDGQVYESRAENGEGYFLTADDMRWFRDHYVGHLEDLTQHRVSPLRGDLSGLPPAVVVTAEFDPLRDEGESYAAALAEAGVRVEQRRYDGLIHGFFDMAALSPACEQAVREACRLLREILDDTRA
jgi:acetyl esterase